MHWGYAVIAAVQLGIQIYGAWKGQKAAEAKADAEKKRLANLKRLAIIKYAHEEGVASKNLSLLNNSKSSYSCPIPKYMTGVLVTATIERAAPPRASASLLVKIAPSKVVCL